MKKIVLILIIALAVTAAGFSQAANYTVQEVTGRVERNAGGDKWEPVKAGETLGADTVVRTVIGANLTVKHGGRNSRGWSHEKRQTFRNRKRQ